MTTLLSGDVCIHFVTMLFFFYFPLVHFRYIYISYFFGIPFSDYGHYNLLGLFAIYNIPSCYTNKITVLVLEIYARIQRLNVWFVYYGCRHPFFICSCCVFSFLFGLSVIYVYSFLPGKGAVLWTHCLKGAVTAWKGSVTTALKGAGNGGRTAVEGAGLYPPADPPSIGEGAPLSPGIRPRML